MRVLWGIRGVLQWNNDDDVNNLHNTYIINYQYYRLFEIHKYTQA